MGWEGREGGERWFRIADPLRSYLNQGCARLILVDRACVEAELYNLHFCSFIRVGQRTNELSPGTVSLVFIFFGKLLDRRTVLEKGQRRRDGFANSFFLFLEVRGISSWGGGILCVPVGPSRRVELRAAWDPGGAASAGLGAGMATRRRCWKAGVKRSDPRGRIGGSCWQRARARGAGAAQLVPARLRAEGLIERRGDEKNRQRKGRKAQGKGFHEHKKRGEGFVATCPPTHRTLHCSEPAGAVRAGR